VSALPRPVSIALVTVVVLLAALPYLSHHVDDAYISYRYAKHLVEGLGLVYNPGEVVEGYTNLLWVLLVAVGLAAGAPPEPVAATLGLAATLATALLVMRHATVLTGHPLAGVLAGGITAAAFPTAVWATAGLETPLFTALVTLGAVALAGSLGAGPRATWVGAVALGLAGWTRPEGWGLLLIAIGWRLLRPGPRTRREAVLPLVVALGVLGGARLGLRLVLYDAWLPNTFHAKVGFQEAPSRLLGRGLDYLGRFVIDLRGLPLLAGLGLLGRPLPRPGVSVLLAGTLGGAVLGVGGDGLTAFRFLVPVVPFLAVAVAVGVHGIGARLAGTARRAVPALLVGVVLVLALLPHLTGRPLRAVRAESREVRAWATMGRWVAANTPRDATLAVLVAGALPYHAERRTLDLLGLTDPVIARTPVIDPGTGQAGHERANTAHVLERRPDLVVIGEYGLHESVNLARPALRFYYRAERELVNDPRFTGRYQLQAASTEDGFFHYFSRID